MVILKEVSINNNITAPKTKGGNRLVKFPAFGIKNIAKAEIIAPTKIKGILRPNRVQVLSLDRPIIGCTIKPANGAASQK